MADYSPYSNRDCGDKPDNSHADIVRLRQLVVYEPDTGVLRWRVTRGKSIEGKQAGCINGRGYVCVNVENRNYLAHRLGWAIYHGEWPKGVIDHVNGDQADNRLENLRDVSQAVNQRNTKGRIGVHRKSSGWAVSACGTYRGFSLCFGKALKSRNEIHAQSEYGPQSAHWKSVGAIAEALVRKAVQQQDAAE